MTAVDLLLLIFTALAVLIGGRVAWRDRRLTARVAALEEHAEQARDGGDGDELALAEAVGLVSDESECAATVVLVDRVPMTGAGVLSAVPDSACETTQQFEPVVGPDVEQIVSDLRRDQQRFGRHAASRGEFR